jgi:hypothetical protein
MKPITSDLQITTLKDAHRKDLAQAVHDNDEVLTTIHSASIGETNHIIYSVTVVITKELEYKVNRTSSKTKESLK